MSELDGQWLWRSAEDDGCGIGKIEHLSIGVIGMVELCQVWMCIDHAYYSIVACLKISFAGDTYPVFASHGGQLYLRIGFHLV